MVRAVFALALCLGVAALTSAQPEVPGPAIVVSVMDPVNNQKIDKGTSYTAEVKFWCPNEPGETYAVGQWIDVQDQNGWKTVEGSEKLSKNLTGEGTQYGSYNFENLSVGSYSVTTAMVRTSDLKFMGGSFALFTINEPSAVRRLRRQ
jgi:hypothetical protein